MTILGSARPHDVDDDYETYLPHYLSAEDMVDDEYGDALHYGLILALVWERLGGRDHPNEDEIFWRLNEKFRSRHSHLDLESFIPFRSGETARVKAHDLRQSLIETYGD